MISLLRARLLRKSTRRSEGEGRWEVAADRYAVLRRIGEARPSDLVRHAMAVEAAGRLDAALLVHQENASALPLNPNIHRQMGLYLLRMGDDSSASLAFARARSLAFGDAVLKSDMERLGFDDAMSRQLAPPAFHAGCPPQPLARSWLDRWIARRAANVAKTLRQNGDWSSAVAAQRKVLQHNPYNVSAHVRLGHALRETGQLEAAEAAYWAGVAVAPQNADAYLQLGHLLRTVVGKDVALPAYLIAWHLAPDLREMKEVLSDYGLSSQDAANLVRVFGLLDPKTTAERVKSASALWMSTSSKGQDFIQARPRARFIDVKAAAVAGDIARVTGTAL